MKTASRSIPFIFISLALAMWLGGTGCIDRETRTVDGIEILEDPNHAVWAVTYGDSIQMIQLPSGTSIHNGPADEVLAVWVDGLLKKNGTDIEWLDFDPESGEYEINPGLELTSWDTPVAVDPESRILYAFAHSVPPSRIIEAHYLDGREPEQVGVLTAEELEILDTLPSNGWPIFYVDRPSQAGAITVDDQPTRRLRVYGGRHIGGEFPDALAFFFLLDGLVIHREEEGWVHLEILADAVHQRTMSLGQIPGDLRPLARAEDEILIAADEIGDDGETITGCRLFTYGLYTREVEEIWDPAVLGQPAVILSIAVLAPDEYYIVLGDIPDRATLTLVRLSGGRWTEHVRARFPEPVTETSIFFRRNPETELGESLEASVSMTEPDVESSEPEDASPSPSPPPEGTPIGIISSG